MTEWSVAVVVVVSNIRWKCSEKFIVVDGNIDGVRLMYARVRVCLCVFSMQLAVHWSSPSSLPSTLFQWFDDVDVVAYTVSFNFHFTGLTRDTPLQYRFVSLLLRSDVTHVMMTLWIIKLCKMICANSYASLFLFGERARMRSLTPSACSTSFTSYTHTDGSISRALCFVRLAHKRLFNTGFCRPKAFIVFFLFFARRFDTLHRHTANVSQRLLSSAAAGPEAALSSTTVFYMYFVLFCVRCIRNINVIVNCVGYELHFNTRLHILKR